MKCNIFQLANLKYSYLNYVYQQIIIHYKQYSPIAHDRLELQVVKEAHLLFKVIDQRYNDNKSLIFTTNVEEPDWAEFLGDPITTSAILDRIFHHSVIVRINGPSYRMYQSELLQKEYAEKKQEKSETG